EYRTRYSHPKELELRGDRATGGRFRARGPQNTSVTMQVTADTGIQRETEMLQHCRSESNCTRASEPEIVRGDGAFRRTRSGLAEEDNRAIYADHFTQQQHEMLHQ